MLLLLGAALNLLGIRYSQSLRPFEFAVMFLVGILLSRHREVLVAGVRRLPRLFHVPLLALALTLYLSIWLGWHADRPEWESSLLDLAITAASAFAIVAALASVYSGEAIDAPPRS